MNNTLFRTGSLLSFRLSSRNTLGHGIHSPYLFYIARALFPETAHYYCFRDIERRRTHLMNMKESVRATDFSGSPTTIGKIAQDSIRHRTEEQILFRLVNFCKAQTIVETGTSLGIATSYLASPDRNATVYTFEKQEELVRIAEQGWKELGIMNVEAITGDYMQTVNAEAKKWSAIDFAYIHNSSKKAEILQVFHMLVPLAQQKSIYAIGNIRHSKETYEAWTEMCKNEKVSAKMDLGNMGLLFFDEHFPNECYKIRI